MSGIQSLFDSCLVGSRIVVSTSICSKVRTVIVDGRRTDVCSFWVIQSRKKLVGCQPNRSAQSRTIRDLGKLSLSWVFQWSTFGFPFICLHAPNVVDFASHSSCRAPQTTTCQKMRSSHQTDFFSAVSFDPPSRE